MAEGEANVSVEISGPTPENDVNPTEESSTPLPEQPAAPEAIPETDEPVDQEKKSDDAPATAVPEVEESDAQKDGTQEQENPPEEGTPTGEETEKSSENDKEDTEKSEKEDTEKSKETEKPGTENMEGDEKKTEEEPTTDTTESSDTKAPESETPLPQNEQFSAGEKPEGTGIEVTAEALSRGGTPTEPLEVPEGEVPRPGTPEKEADEKNVIFDDEQPVPRFTRDELIERYHVALQERELLNQKNSALQHKLAEYFRRKKTEESRQEVDRNVTDQEQRYMKYMSNLEELRQQEAGERESYDEQIEEIKERRAAKQGLVEEEWGNYCHFKRSVALSSAYSRSGRQLTAKDFEPYEINEAKKEGEVSQVRLENIKLRNRLRKRELQLKQKEELAEGLHLIDFEQLKIENQTYNEKIEERNEELMKLRKKITNTVQVLTHLKEKLQFVQGENQVARQDLGCVEMEVAKKRDILSRTKQARDALRHDNSKLRQKCGLLGNPLLLRDYEEGTDEITDLSHKLDQLKRTHAELTLSISGVKKKVEQTKALAQS